MIFKRATCDNMMPLGALLSDVGMVKLASGSITVEPGSDKYKIIEAELQKHPTALFFRSKAIKADEANANGDYFSESELKRAYKSFEGVPFFTNHDNQNVENARGKIIFAEWVPEEKSIYTISFVDREAYPHICRSIEEEYITGVSMGCSVEYSVCNICGNKAEKTEDYCFTPGTLITMIDGSVKNIEDIKIGDKVIDAFGKETMVTECFVHAVNGELLSITSKAIDGELVCTKNHPFLAERRGELIFIPSEYLIEKDTLFLPIIAAKESEELFDIFSRNNIEVTEDNKLKLSKLIGYYIAEGSLIHNDKQEDIGFALSLGSDEKDLIEDARSIIVSLFNKEPEIVDRNVYNHKAVDIRIYHPMAVELIRNSCSGKAKDKKITPQVFNLPLKYLQEILAGYIDGDGYSDKYGRMVLTTASRNLAYQLINVLIKIGIPPSIYSYLQNGGPNNRDDISYKIYRISIGSVPTLLFKNTSLKCKKSQIIASQIKGISKNKKAFDHSGFVKHASYSIDPVNYSGPVYNFETETHSYVANNTAVHNCSHIRERKGRTFSGKAKDVKTGEVKEFRNHPVFEYNYGIKFIELSAVVDPACPSCRIQGLIKNDDLLKKVANVQNNIYMYKTASILKEAGQQEIQQLNQVLQTLEAISIELIKNRQQVEVEFASDLVNILSELQVFVDELVGAGYGSVQPGGVPGVANPPAAAPAPAGGAGFPPPAQPVAEETPLAAPAVGSISGAPGKPLVQAPNLPISAPAKPRASSNGEKIQKIAGLLIDLSERLNNTGEDDMANRRTLEAKNKQKEIATKVLSSSWQEKQYFFEYINKVPSIQDNEHKLSIKKRDDSFVVVAETKDGSPSEMVWTYETLTNDEKDLIQRSPKEAASYFLNRFAGSLKLNKKQGETVMASTNKEAGAKSINKTPEVITEKQLDEGALYHSRTDDPKNVITEKQLEEKRADKVEEVITEAQLAAKSNKLNPRTEDVAEVITEAQLKDKDGASPRTESPVEVITQAQLEPNRTGTETDVITEKQLDAVDTPWARAASRDAKMFKAAGDHMKAVVDVMADTVISTGCTPDEACKVAASLISSTKDRYALGNAILDKSSEEDVDYSKRLAYWSKKNVKVASVGSKEIAQSIVSGLRKVASDVTINPDTVIDALDVVSESKDGEDSISAKVDQKLEAAAKETVRVSKKDELRKALQQTLVAKTDKVARDQERKEVVESVKQEDQKTQREAERAIWNKVADSKKNDKEHDTIIEASLGELGCKKDDPNFKTAIRSFARGALAAQNIKLAAVTNVTISGDTISIAVQTDAGEESVEIPVGEGAAPVDSEVVPEGDIAGEGMEANLGAAPAPAPADAGLPAMASAKNVVKTAQVPAGGGGMPGGAGAGVPSGAPEAGGLPGAAPAESPVASLTTDEPAEIDDEIPTAGEQQPPWSICPECGSSDVDVSADDAGNGKGSCQNCGAEYEALVKKEVEFKITKPTRSVGKEEATGAPEVPEVPALPVAAQTKLNKDVLKRIASNKGKHGHVCPACGMKQLKATAEKADHSEFGCPACGTQIEKDVMINVNNPDQSYLRVKWDLVPKTAGCKGCEESVKKFASMVRVQNMMKTAQSGDSKFPMANCIERIARKFGGNSVATFGPCKGKALADCVCGQLEKLGMTKVRHMEKLASVYTQKDPMDECVEDQMKNKYSKKEATTICNCLKKKFASKEDSNVFLMAFAEDIKSGKEKILTAQDLDAINDVFKDEAPVEEPAPMDEDADMGDPMPEAETVTLEVSKETAEELADAVKTAVPEEVEIEVEASPVEDVKAPPALEKDKTAEFGVKKDECKEEKKETSDNCEKEKEMATAMKVHQILRVGEEVIKVAATPTKVEDIEGNVEAGVPRGEAKMGEESKADSMINKTLAKPSVPRGNAYMGKEKEADSLINKELKLPDVPVDSAYMGVNEKSNQSGMPAINNEIKGTVIAKEDKTVKEAKKMKEVDTVEGDVEAGVPRGKATMGKEGPDNIDVKLDKPDVPRAKSTLGKEGPDNIDVKMDAPDVPVDSAYMGHEKEVQKGMPAINDEILKNVKQSREIQIERIASARRMKAVEVTAKLLATARITEEAYDNVIEALSKFEIDKIASVADNMYPKAKKQSSSQASKEVYAGPAIVMESKEIKPSDPVNDLTKRIASAFTIGNKSFDENLTRFGDK